MSSMKNKIPETLEIKVSLEINEIAEDIVKKVIYEYESLSHEEYLNELNKVKNIIKKRIIPLGDRALKEAMIRYIASFYKNME